MLICMGPGGIYRVNAKPPEKNVYKILIKIVFVKVRTGLSNVKALLHINSRTYLLKDLLLDQIIS